MAAASTERLWLPCPARRKRSAPPAPRIRRRPARLELARISFHFMRTEIGASIPARPNDAVPPRRSSLLGGLYDRQTNEASPAPKPNSLSLRGRGRPYSRSDG